MTGSLYHGAMIKFGGRPVPEKMTEFQKLFWKFVDDLGALAEKKDGKPVFPAQPKKAATPTPPVEIEK